MERANGTHPVLTYQEALKKILEHSFPLRPKLFPLKESLGHVVAKDMVSREPFPSFDNSAVDGYAVSIGTRWGSSEKVKAQIRGEVPAGECYRKFLKPGQAVRIFTGAPIPRGTEAVVMQEHCEKLNGHIFLLKSLKPGDNIRFRGEDFQRGRVLVRRSTYLTPSHLAVLATVGYEKIPVYPSPEVTILTTGSELVRKGEKLRAGKIRDSNTILLESLVRRAGGTPHVLSTVGDQPREIRSWIRKGLEKDLFLISGGVSVGKYDFVKEVLQKEGVQEIFWKVNIKPGKPLFFGKKSRTLVFGLPGNPVSVFVTFEEFVKPALLKMKGRPLMRKEIEGHLTHSFQNGPRLHFIRVRSARMKTGYAITPLKGQGSHMIGELASANSLLRVEPNAVLRRGQRVSVRLMEEE